MASMDTSTRGRGSTAHPTNSSGPQTRGDMAPTTQSIKLKPTVAFVQYNYERTPKQQQRVQDLNEKRRKAKAMLVRANSMLRTEERNFRNQRRDSKLTALQDGIEPNPGPIVLKNKRVWFPQDTFGRAMVTPLLNPTSYLTPKDVWGNDFPFEDEDPDDPMGSDLAVNGLLYDDMCWHLQLSDQTDRTYVAEDKSFWVTHLFYHVAQTHELYLYPFKDPLGPRSFRVTYTIQRTPMPWVHGVQPGDLVDYYGDPDEFLEVPHDQPEDEFAPTCLVYVVSSCEDYGRMVIPASRGHKWLRLLLLMAGIEPNPGPITVKALRRQLLQVTKDGACIYPRYVTDADLARAASNVAPYNELVLILRGDKAGLYDSILTWSQSLRVEHATKTRLEEDIEGLYPARPKLTIIRPISAPAACSGLASSPPPVAVPAPQKPEVAPAVPAQAQQGAPVPPPAPVVGPAVPPAADLYEPNRKPEIIPPVDGRRVDVDDGLRAKPFFKITRGVVEWSSVDTHVPVDWPRRSIVKDGKLAWEDEPDPRPVDFRVAPVSMRRPVRQRVQHRVLYVSVGCAKLVALTLSLLVLMAPVDEYLMRYSAKDHQYTVGRVGLTRLAIGMGRLCIHTSQFIIRVLFYVLPQWVLWLNFALDEHLLMYFNTTAPSVAEVDQAPWYWWWFGYGLYRTNSTTEFYMHEGLGHVAGAYRKVRFYVLDYVLKMWESVCNHWRYALWLLCSIRYRSRKYKVAPAWMSVLAANNYSRDQKTRQLMSSQHLNRAVTLRLPVRSYTRYMQDTREYFLMGHECSVSLNCTSAVLPAQLSND